MTATQEDLLALRALSERYASAVDRRDPDALVTVFATDARLRLFEPGSEEPIADRRGHADLALIPQRVSHYEKTFHLVGNAVYDIGDREATGEVYCIAHHLQAGESRSDYVMFVRYLDSYRREDEASWLIADRQVVIDWTEHRPADP